MSVFFYFIFLVILFIIVLFKSVSVHVIVIGKHTRTSLMIERLRSRNAAETGEEALAG